TLPLTGRSTLHLDERFQTMLLNALGSVPIFEAHAHADGVPRTPSMVATVAGPHRDRHPSLPLLRARAPGALRRRATSRFQRARWAARLATTKRHFLNSMTAEFDPLQIRRYCELPNLPPSTCAQKYNTILRRCPAGPPLLPISTTNGPPWIRTHPTPPPRHL